MTTQHSERFVLRSGITLTPKQYERLDRLVSELAANTPAQTALLVDVTGQVVLAKGMSPQTNLAALGSLVASDLAASQEIARLTGEYEEYQLVLREGRSSHTLIIPAGQYLALLVQVAPDTPLGWARLLIRKTARQIADTAATGHSTSVPETEALLQDNLADMFDDALDNLWSE